MSVSSETGVSLGRSGSIPTEFIALLSQTGAGSFVLPAKARIKEITVRNLTANAVTGGLKFGKTSGQTDVVAALAVGASAFVSPVSNLILQRIFSYTATQTIFFDAVAAWNSASVDITVLFERIP
jgi:hypothetical protein